MTQHSVEAPARGEELAAAESQSNAVRRPAPSLPASHRPPPQLRGAFQWTGQDAADTSWLACQLGAIRRLEDGEEIIITSIELQLRPPRLLDAWTFFRAAALLRDARSSHAARAQQIGCRIALAVTGWIVLDMALCEVGASVGVGVFTIHHDLPVIVRLDQDGRSPLDADADTVGNT